MPGCCVPMCYNSGVKGYLMKRFPRDPTRRAIWAQFVSREDWAPNDNSYICEVHFADDMWEQNRIDGLQKLRRNAIPTLFEHYIIETLLEVDEK